jgi:hypothetical protein
MTGIVTASRRVALRALHYLMNGTLNMMKGLILFALMVCVVGSLVRHPPGAVFNNRRDHDGNH